MLGRRIFGFGVASALLGQRAVAAQTRVKPASGRGLFWGVQAAAPAVIYGYGRTSTVVAPDILDDGQRFVEQTQRVIGTMPNVSLAATSLAPPSMAPGGAPANTSRSRVATYWRPTSTWRARRKKSPAWKPWRGC
jgi:hypothetical protein